MKQQYGRIARARWSLILAKASDRCSFRGCGIGTASCGQKADGRSRNFWRKDTGRTTYQLGLNSNHGKECLAKHARAPPKRLLARGHLSKTKRKQNVSSDLFHGQMARWAWGS